MLQVHIHVEFFELFFVKKYLLVSAWGMLWAGGSVVQLFSGSVVQWFSGSVVQWISGSVRDVCISHQSGWIYY